MNMRQGGKDMNGRDGDPNLLRRYLLGDLNDEVTLDKIELRLISDGEFADWVTVAENDLIEGYLDGDLSAEDTERFIRHFLISPERKQQLRLTENLRKLAAKSAIPPHAKRSPFDWTPKLSRMWLRFAVFALVIVAAILGIWRFAVYRSDADMGLAELRNAYRGQRPIEPRITALPEYAPFSETRGPLVPAVHLAAADPAERYLPEAARDSAGARAHPALAVLCLPEKKSC